jgi:hypothetical protein
MSWTTPRTWTTNELVTAALMNTHIKDNSDYLKARMPITHTANASSATTTASESYGTINTMTTTFTPVVTGKALCMLAFTSDPNAGGPPTLSASIVAGGSTIGQPVEVKPYASDGQEQSGIVIGEAAITAGTPITVTGMWKMSGSGTARMTYRVLHVTELCTE